MERKRVLPGAEAAGYLRAGAEAVAVNRQSKVIRFAFVLSEFIDFFCFSFMFWSCIVVYYMKKISKTKISNLKLLKKKLSVWRQTAF